MLVEIGPGSDGYPGQFHDGTFANDLGDYYADNVERLKPGTLYGSVQGAANDCVADTTGDTQETVDGLRSVTDLLTGKTLEKAGPLGDIVGCAAVDSFWEGCGGRRHRRGGR